MLRIRQVALVAHDLEGIVDQLRDTLGLQRCFRDPGVAQFGLCNAVFAVGNTFLEVVSPNQAGTTAGRLLERRGGDGGYMVLLQTDALANDRARFRDLGVREVWQIELGDIAAVHLHPKDVGAAVVSFDQATPPESWRWGGPDWQGHVHPQRVTAIVGADLQSADPKATAARWSEVLARPLRALSGDELAIDLDGGTLRFVRDRDGRGDGLSAVAFRCAPGVVLEDTMVCGTHLRFVCTEAR